MKILALDTSSKSLAVAVAKDENLLCEINFSGALKHSENLIFLINAGLESLALKIEDIDIFAVGRGPGSFTGLRIGLATLKGFKLILDRPCLGLSSLDVLAENFPYPEGDLAVAVDARRDRIYGAFYRVNNGEKNKILCDSVFNLQEILERSASKTYFLGDALDKYGLKIKKALGKKAVFLGSDYWYPRAKNLAKLAYSESKKNNFLKIKDLLPVYLRKPEPIEKLQLSRSV